MKRLLIYGGTFDPVHHGHIAAWHAAVAAIAPDYRLLIPVGNPWQKARAPLASGEHRAAMLARALPDAQIDLREVHRRGPTYTVDTLRELVGEYPDAACYWLLGGDSAARLDTWHDAASLAKLATFVVVRRAGEPFAAPAGNFRCMPIDADPPPVSSTAIRAAIAAGGTLRGLTPDSVCDYIAKHHLYEEPRLG